MEYLELFPSAELKKKKEKKYKISPGEYSNQYRRVQQTIHNL